jgi:hypothetical protein
MKTFALLKCCLLLIAGLAFPADDPPINEEEIKRSASNLNVTVEIVDNTDPAHSLF